MTGRNRTRIRLAVTGLLAVALLVFGIVVVTSDDGPDGQRITVSFDSVNGLIAGAQVRAGSVEVGKVTKVELGEDDVPYATLRLEDDFVAHEGATANLRMLSQAGQLNRYVELTTGTGRVLGDGAVIGLNGSDQPVELDDAFSTVTPEVRADVRRIAASLDRGLKGHGGDLSDAIEHSDRALHESSLLVADLAADAPALRRLVRESSTLVSELAEDPEGLQAVADELAQTLAVTAKRQQELGRTVDGLGPGLRGARRSLDEINETIPAIRELADAAGPAAREARASAPTIRRLLEAAPPALAEAQELIETAPAQLEAMKPLLAEARPVVQKLPGALKQFAPVLDEMRARAPDALGWLPLLGDAMSNFDVNGHAWRVAFVATPAPQKEASTTRNDAGLLPAPFDRVPGANNNEPWLDFRDSFVGGKPWAPKGVTTK